MSEVRFYENTQDQAQLISLLLPATKGRATRLVTRGVFFASRSLQVAGASHACLRKQWIENRNDRLTRSDLGGL